MWSSSLWIFKSSSKFKLSGDVWGCCPITPIDTPTLWDDADRFMGLVGRPNRGETLGNILVDCECEWECLFPKSEAFFISFDANLFNILIGDLVGTAVLVER